MWCSFVSNAVAIISTTTEIRCSSARAFSGEDLGLQPRDQSWPLLSALPISAMNHPRVHFPYSPLYQILFVGIAVLLVTGKFLGVPGDIVD